jgi:hypothetical protein
LHSLTKLWFQRWLVWLWQCVQCGSAIVLKNVRWQKNKKHRVGLSVGSFVLSIFRFPVLSQWFTFQFIVVSVFFLHLAVTSGSFAFGREIEARLLNLLLIFYRSTNVEFCTSARLTQNCLL